MRTLRSAAVGAALVALLASACGPGAGSPSPIGGTASPGPATPSPNLPAETLAGTLVFGGPAECPERPFCLIGLRDTYGLEFAQFLTLDAGGPITVAALDDGQVDVGLMFTSDPTIGARDFVILEDDRQLMRADNLVPVVEKAMVEQQPLISEILNRVSAQLTQAELVELNRQAIEDRRDPREIAEAWLTEKELLVPNDEIPDFRPIIIGKTNFYEQDILAELYALPLEEAGYRVTRQETSGNREIVFPALAAGQLDILPEYAATSLEFVNQGAGEATPFAEETTELLRMRLELRGLTALDPAPATNQNAIVVTRATADRYRLTKISDLAQPAPD